MPHLDVNGTRLFYEETGSGQETVVFSSSYLLNHTHYAPQIEALKARYRIIAYDHRGHRESAPLDRPTTMQEIVDDGIGVIERLADGPVHWIGLSTGGFVGMRIALQRPELLRSQTLMSTSADAEPLPARILYSVLLLAMRVFGIERVLGQGTSKLFGERFREDPANAACLAEQEQLILSQDTASMVHFGHAIFARDDVAARMHEIRIPTLVVTGELDTGEPPLRGQRIAERIPGARFELIPGAGHICTLEAPVHVTERLVSFLDSVTQPPR